MNIIFRFNASSSYTAFVTGVIRAEVVVFDVDVNVIISHQLGVLSDSDLNFASICLSLLLFPLIMEIIRGIVI